MLKEYYEIVEKAKANPYGFEHALLADEWNGLPDHNKECFIANVVNSYNDLQSRKNEGWVTTFAEDYWKHQGPGSDAEKFMRVLRLTQTCGCKPLPTQEYPELEGLLF